MATNRKRLQVYLTDAQYEQFKQIAVQIGAQSASQLAAEILIKECRLTGEAPERGKYYRAEYQVNEDGTHSPDYRRVEMTVADEADFAALVKDQASNEENLMLSGALERIKARKS